MIVKKCSAKTGILGITGHAGAGHVHSHSGFVQDDSAGFAVIACLLRKAYPVNSTIVQIDADIESGMVRITTEDGGIGMSPVRRGITPYEASLAQRAVGLDGIYSQVAAFTAFGRIYGQGCLELPVALQTATCIAVMDTFARKYPDSCFVQFEDREGKNDQCIGAVIEIDGVPVSVMGILNATTDGLGPNEDLEGNVMLGQKGLLMKTLGLNRLPTIILESKAYIPAISNTLQENTFVARINKEHDNRIVYDALAHGAAKAEIPFIQYENAYPRHMGEMAEATRNLGLKIAQLGNRLTGAETAKEKVEIIGELAILISQDAGGITYMSSELHDLVAGGGVLPGTAAVFSMAITEAEIRFWKIPTFRPQDSDLYLTVLKHAVPYLADKIEAATAELQEKWSFSAQKYSYLFPRIS